MSGGPCRVFFSRDRQSARGSCAQSLDEGLCSAARVTRDPLARSVARPCPFRSRRCPIRCPFGKQQRRQCCDFASFAPSTCRSMIAEKPSAPAQHCVTLCDWRSLGSGPASPTVRAASQRADPYLNPPDRQEAAQPTESANARSDIRHGGIGHVPYSGEGIVHVFDHREQKGEDSSSCRY